MGAGIQRSLQRFVTFSAVEPVYSGGIKGPSHLGMAGLLDPVGAVAAGGEQAFASVVGEVAEVAAINRPSYLGLMFGWIFIV
jgi:hypothetical protein